MKLFRVQAILLASLVSAFALSSCSSGPQVKQQAYAKLKDSREFEYDFPTVWKGVEEAFRNYSVIKRSPGDVDDVELRKLHKRTLETDWIQTQSRDKYVEYKVNDVPRKRYLWTRIKYKLTAEQSFGGVSVTVKPEEEVEKLNDDASSAGYDKVDNVDPSRANEILDKIQNAILSAPPASS